MKCKYCNDRPALGSTSTCNACFEVASRLSYVISDEALMKILPDAKPGLLSKLHNEGYERGVRDAESRLYTEKGPRWLQRR